MMRVEVTTDDGVALSARVFGQESAPALLLLHSLGCDTQMWEPQIAALSSRRRVIALDTRGHGASAAPHGDYTLDRLGRDAVALLDRLGVPRADVCGISLGGAMAQWLALEAPARVGRLVLANTASRLGSAESWAARIAAVRAGGVAAVADAALERFFSTGFRSAQPDVVARFRQRLLATDTHGYAGCCAALRDSDLTSSVGRIAAPVLVIGGSMDPSTPPEQAQALAAAIPGARLLMFDCAHLSNVERPEAFTAALVQHLPPQGLP